VKLAYRPEIDGLRTIAVLAVIIYHLDVVLGNTQLLKGGFLGVDVFFVISGFLITSIIMSEYHNTQGFSLVNFYERRARRLLPALFTVILVSLPFAWYLLLPSQLEDFAKSILSTLAFGSNFYWDISLQEYGAESAQLKPFLHTWTLAVEEQYYIFFPLILLAVYKWWKSHTVVILLALLLLSLQFADYMTPIDHSFSFYMLPTRFWELLAGSLLANILYYHPKEENDTLLNKTMPILGLYLVVHSLFFVEFESNHPGFITLLPVIGTVLIIWFANKDELVTKVLSSKLFVGVGLLSYSLYLWHYPIFAFGRIIDSSPTWHDKTQWLLLTFTLSLASYALIEKPLRNRERVATKNFLTLIGVALVTIILLTTMPLTGKVEGYQRYKLDELYGQNNPDNQMLGKQSWSLLKEMERNWNTGSMHHEKVKLLLIGNSHSKDIYNALIQNPSLMKKYEVKRQGLQIGMPKEKLVSMFDSELFSNADAILITTRYVKTKKQHEVHDLKRLGWVIDELKKRDKIVAVATNTVEFRAIEKKPIFDYFMTQDKIIDEDQLKSKFFQNINANKLEINKNVTRIAEKHNAILLKKEDFICDFKEKMCDGITDEGFKTFYDYGHYTLEGARYFGKRIEEINWLAPIEKFTNKLQKINN